MTTTAYDLLGITPDATRADLDAAYASRVARYSPTLVEGMGPEFEALAAERRAALAEAYHNLRPALAAPPQLEAAVERRRDRQTLWALFALVTAGLTLVLLRGVGVPQRTVVAQGADTAAKTAQTAPGFTLTTMDGQSVSLADYHGKVVLVNIWATWCPPCVREIPRLVRTYEQYKGQDFVLLGLNTTFQDDAAKVATFARDQGITYPVLLDTTGETSMAYAGRLMPTSYLIDRSGRIVSVQVGEVDEAALKEQVAALLSSSAQP